MQWPVLPVLRGACLNPLEMTTIPSPPKKEIRKTLAVWKELISKLQTLLFPPEHAPQALLREETPLEVDLLNVGRVKEIDQATFPLK